jgi:hypothetical protein
MRLDGLPAVFLREIQRLCWVASVAPDFRKGLCNHTRRSVCERLLDRLAPLYKAINRVGVCVVA